MRSKNVSAGGAPLLEPAADVVIDFTDSAPVDLGGLTLLLTAQQMAQETDRKVWLRALPHRTWQLLYALGLEDCFELFPAGGEAMN
ncbi:MAG: STAS domain-containing protein [Gemmatimonadetes bacterium]|nr:STAS domain-containing protein [Gemmatimonadota bacterium]